MEWRDEPAPHNIACHPAALVACIGSRRASCEFWFAWLSSCPCRSRGQIGDSRTEVRMVLGVSDGFKVGQDIVGLIAGVDQQVHDEFALNLGECAVRYTDASHYVDDLLADDGGEVRFFVAFTKRLLSQLRVGTIAEGGYYRGRHALLQRPRVSGHR